MCHVFASPAFSDVVEHLITPLMAQINIEVRHANAFRIKKTFEDQPVIERIDSANVQQIRNHTANAAASPRTNRNTIPLGIRHNIMHD